MNRKIHEGIKPALGMQAKILCLHLAKIEATARPLFAGTPKFLEQL